MKTFIRNFQYWLELICEKDEDYIEKGSVYFFSLLGSDYTAEDEVFEFLQKVYYENFS
jgi:hypothetical protein